MLLEARTSLRPTLDTFTQLTITALELSFCVTASFLGSAGISTCCPSPTTSVLGLGPDLPWVDEPSPGNLGLSTAMFLAWLSLLIPAFSLLYSPPVLPVWLQPVHYAPLPLNTVISTLGDTLCLREFARALSLSPFCISILLAREKYPNSEITVLNPPLR